MLDHKHCLMAWAMVHSGFLLNRFVTKAGSTPFELVSGKPFSGRLAMFAEPVMAFVATKETPKGDARWERSIVLTKAGMTDMCLVFCKGRIRLTRSIRRCFADWKWQLEGVLGAKLQPSITKPGEKPEAIEPLPFAGALADTSAGDEAAEDPKSDKGNEPSEDSVTPSSRASMEMDAQQAGNLQVPAIAASSAGQSAAVLPDTTTLEELFLVDRNLEESPKRMRLDETGKATHEKSGRIGRLAHLDYDEFEALDGKELDAELFDRPDYLQDADEKFVQEEIPKELSDLETQLMRSRTDEREPELSEEELEIEMLDGIARQLEVQRLKGMQVLLELDAVAEEDQDSPLSAKFVYTWRRKEYQGSPIWLRRARLVAREFNFMEVNDVFSPASPTLLTKLLPLLECSSIYGANSVIGSLDISDAFLMVPQERPMSYLIAKCLPGQRAGARRWYDHVVQVLTEGAGMEVSDECPTLLRDKRGRGCLLMHVDDMTFSGTEHWVEDVLIANLKQRYRVTYTIAKKAGDEFSFLKRAW